MTAINTQATSKQLVWLITGTSSGFGRRLALIAYKRGDKVIATARTLSQINDFPESDRMLTMQLDITEGLESITQKVNAAVSHFGRIDVVVNNAAIGARALVEEGRSDMFMHQVRTNVCGVLDVTCAVLPYMRAQKSGTIVIIGSRSSWEGEVPTRGFYGASKAAVRVLGESLQAEVKQFGIRVLIVEPGPYRTEGILSQPVYEGNRIHDYDPMMQYIDHIVKTTIDGRQPGDPLKAMEVVADLVRGEGCAAGKKMPLILPLGREAENAIRDKCKMMLEIVDEWGEIIRDTRLDGM